jgi:hypothetical protein
MIGPILVAILALSQQVEPDLPFRTDRSNEHLSWYQVKGFEFPPHRSEHRVSGELIEADFIHRKGQFRATGTGQIIDFTLLPCATVMAFGAEGDLRDLPLGTLCQFSTYRDDRGDFTRVAAIHDEFSRLAGQGIFYRLEGLKLDEGKIEATSPSGRVSLLVNQKTRVWNGKGRGALVDLAIGDELVVNLAGNSGSCADLWAGAEASKLATDQQQQRHAAFLRLRGLASRIDRVDGKKLTVSLFGDPSSLQDLFRRDGIVPAQWAKEHRSVDAVVANEELRTYNPPVDRKRSRVLEFQPIPTNSHGSSGIQWIIEPELLLEGFRKGRIIRLFAHHSWPVDDMPFGECLYYETPNVRPLTEEALHYPYRTDFANADLPWYQLKPGEFPPLNSDHRVVGELFKVDAAGRSGQFRTDRTGELIDFTMPPFGAVVVLQAEADLRDLRPGTRYHFFLYQDDQGAFTRAALILDDFTVLARDELTYRLDEVDREAGKIFLARRHAPVKNDKDALIQPPDLGRGVYAIDSRTRIWNGNARLEPNALVVGDELLVNFSGESATDRGVCTDIWVGRETHKLACKEQRSKFDVTVRGMGLPAWIDRVDGKNLTITFFSGVRQDFPSRLDQGVTGPGVSILLVNDELQPIGDRIDKLRFKDPHSEGASNATYGSSGVHWTIEVDKIDERYRPGQVIRVFREGWTAPVPPTGVQ